MGNSKTTIELNGRRYDARTGQIIADSNRPIPAATERSTPQAAPKAQGQILDGFIKRPKTTASHPAQIRPSVKVTVAAATASPMNVAEKSAAITKPNNAVRKVQKSKTLMRPAVKKPAVIKNDVQAMKPVVKPLGFSAARQARAEAFSRSPQVSKFRAKPSVVVKKEAVLPVVEPSLPAISKAVSTELHRLEDALEDANAHLHTLEEHMVKKVPFLRRVGFKNKAANLSAIACAMLLLVGFFGYQNKAAIEMQVAASRSGVSASLPGYKPAGYAINGGIKSEPGAVSVAFKSRTNDKGFTLTQRSSNWNSTALLANHVTKTRCNTCFQTWQNEGKTVYIYDNSNATWVNGGVWYTLEGNAELTSDQLLKVANSL